MKEYLFKAHVIWTTLFLCPTEEKPACRKEADALKSLEKDPCSPCLVGRLHELLLPMVA